MVMQIATLLAWLAGPLALVAMIDDWFLRPGRRIAALPAAAADPPLVRVVYMLLPVAVVGSIVRLLGSEQLDFSLVLVLVVVAAGLVRLLDHFLLAPGRARAAARAGVESAAQPLPVTVDYARSFLPVAALVLVLRSFLFEPFRIPSDSMMPTLEEGDFLIVNKYAYGLRLPVLNRKIVALGDPQRGDVIVFHYPPNPAVNYIKRVVGLPGDVVRVRDDKLIINGTPVPITEDGRYNDGCYLNMRLSTEQLGTHRHLTLSCRSSDYLQAPPVASCNRHIQQSYQCDESVGESQPDRNDTVEDLVVPPGEYLMIGDNRDNSLDGRFWGFVPEDHLVGRAARIWLNLPLGRSGWPDWHRIGKRIE